MAADFGAGNFADRPFWPQAAGMVMRRARSPVLQKPRYRTQSDAFANAKTNVGIIGPFDNLPVGIVFVPTGKLPRRKADAGNRIAPPITAAAFGNGDPI